jgi:hypothetical protein
MIYALTTLALTPELGQQIRLTLESGKLLLKVVLYGSDDQRRAKKLVFMPNSRRKRLKVPIEKEVCIVRSKIRRLYLRFPLGF